MLKKSKLSIDLKNKSALISGGSSGIGGSIANSLINSGCKVGIFSRDIKKLEKKISSGKIETPEDIANFTMYLCSSFSNNINGAKIVIDGGESISY